MTVGVAALAAVLLAAPSPSSPLEVSLDVDRCPLLPPEQVFQLVALELDVRVKPPDRPASAQTTSTPQMTNTTQTTLVEVACEGTEVQLQVSDSLTGKRLMRTMALAERNAQVATRLVAIAVAELVLTSWMELTLPRAPAAPPADGPPAAPELRRAAQERAQRHLRGVAGTGYVLAVGQALGPFEGVGLAWGGGLRFGWTPGGARDEDDTPAWRPGFDLELTGAGNETRRGIGDVDVSMWSAALRASLRYVRGRSWFDAGGGGRVGVARLAATPYDVTTTRGATLAGTWAGPIAYVGVGRRFWRLVAAAGIEGGTALRTVSGLVDDGPSIAIAGRWLSGTVAIGWGG